MGFFRYLRELVWWLPNRAASAVIRELDRFDAYDREHNPHRADT